MRTGGHGTGPGRTDAPAIEVDAVSKRFDDTLALDRVTCDIRPGEVFGFIGPDGAGKTTLFRILATLLVPDAGAARVMGVDVVAGMWELRRRIGYMPGRFSLYQDLSVEENLRFYASVFGTTVEREYELIEPIYKQIEPFRDRRAGALSGGMKQKLALCCALVHRPEVLLLDEPTTGVDAVSRREFWDLLDTLREGGLTILVSTPYMDEAARCDRVALIQRGRILRVDTPSAITAAYDFPLLAVRAADRYGVLLKLRQHPHVRAVFPFGATLHFTDTRADRPADDLARELEEWLHRNGFPDSDAAPITANVEDSFIALMGGRTGDAA